MSTIKVDTVTTLDGTGNITLSRPLTGLSGSGKTKIAEKIASKICRLYGPTLHVNGDDFRKTFKPIIK